MNMHIANSLMHNVGSLPWSQAVEKSLLGTCLAVVTTFLVTDGGRSPRRIRVRSCPSSARPVRWGWCQCSRSPRGRALRLAHHVTMGVRVALSDVCFSAVPETLFLAVVPTHGLPPERALAFGRESDNRRGGLNVDSVRGVPWLAMIISFIFVPRRPPSDFGIRSSCDTAWCDDDPATLVIMSSHSHPFAPLPPLPFHLLPTRVRSLYSLSFPGQTLAEAVGFATRCSKTRPPTTLRTCALAAASAQLSLVVSPAASRALGDNRP